ncbi:hypothetical protein [Salinicoccus albus]|uniref:hypothetical protein n=1 Tax=Salinicoccus albus TaxID=418756 RepID=UPI000368BD23|nr:hypothetical protein [Salinicoccus albus]
MARDSSLRRKIYEYYYDDAFIMRGTIDEIAEHMGITPKSARVLASNTKHGRESRQAIEFTGEVIEAEFAYYRGDALVMFGTIDEIVAQTGLKYSTAIWYTYPAADRGRSKLERVDDSYE